MRALVQRVSRAEVRVGSDVAGKIGDGLVVLLGVHRDDAEPESSYLAAKCASVRIFGDAEGKMNLSVDEAGGSVLVVSQFTLYGDGRKGNRPSFTEAAPPDKAERLYEHFCGELAARLGPGRVARGVFRAMMDVELVNAGPVTLMLESRDRSGGPT